MQAPIKWEPQKQRTDETQTKAALAARKGTSQRAPTPGTGPPSLAQSPALSQPPATPAGKRKDVSLKLTCHCADLCNLPSQH